MYNNQREAFMAYIRGDSVSFFSEDTYRAYYGAKRLYLQ